MQTNVVSYTPRSYNASNLSGHRKAGSNQNTNIKFGMIEPVSCLATCAGCCSLPILLPIIAGVLIFGGKAILGLLRGK